MNSHRFLSVLLLAACASVLASPLSFCKSKDSFTEAGTLTEMQAVPCGSRAKGFTGIGGLLATAGLEDVNSKDKLCQEYVLRTSYIEYRIRPVNDKDAALLPVGEKSRFRLVKDRVLLAVPDGDGKVREYKVVGMRPLHMEEDSRAAAAEPAQAPPRLERRPAADPVQSDEAAPAAPTAQVATPPFAARPISPVQPAASPASAPATPPAPEAEPDSAGNEPLTRAQVMGLVAGGVASERVIALVDKRGLSFQPTPEFLADLKSVGASDELLHRLSQTQSKVPPDTHTGAGALEGQQPPPAPSVDPAQLGQLHDAEQRDRTAELSRPDDPNVHFALADVLGREGKWSEAAAQYAAVIDNQPNDAAAHNDLALALRKSGDLGGAIREYRRAVALEPARAAFHDNLGVALSQKGDAGGAIAEFREAVREDPASIQAHDNLGSMLVEQKDLDSAIREYQQALSLGGGAEAQYNLATALELKGNLDAAIAGFHQALTASPNDVRAHCALAGALERKGDLGGALQQYAIAVKLAPQDPTIRANYDRLAKSSSAQNMGSGS